MLQRRVALCQARELFKCQILGNFGSTGVRRLGESCASGTLLCFVCDTYISGYCVLLVFV